MGLKDYYLSLGWTNAKIGTRLLGKTFKVKTTVKVPPNAEWIIIENIKAVKAAWTSRNMVGVEVDALLLKDILTANISSSADSGNAWVEDSRSYRCCRTRRTPRRTSSSRLRRWRT